MDYGLVLLVNENNAHIIFEVLILVVVDYGLVQMSRELTADEQLVLILVVVDYGLVQVIESRCIKGDKCLNPCCSGLWSRTAFAIIFDVCIITS